MGWVRQQHHSMGRRRRQRGVFFEAVTALALNPPFIALETGYVNRFFAPPMTLPTQPLALTATYLAWLQPRQAGSPAAAPPAPPSEARPAALCRRRYIDILV
jgi:hypothetical protein